MEGGEARRTGGETHKERRRKKRRRRESERVWGTSAHRGVPRDPGRDLWVGEMGRRRKTQRKRRHSK